MHRAPWSSLWSFRSARRASWRSLDPRVCSPAAFQRALRCSSRCLSRSAPLADLLSLRGFTFSLLGLQLCQQGVESAVVAFPVPAVTLKPFGGFREWLRLETSRTALRVAAPRNESSALEHLEMLGDRRLAHRKRLRQLHHRRLARRETGEDRPPSGIGERRESRVKTMRAELPVTPGIHN